MIQSEVSWWILIVSNSAFCGGEMESTGLGKHVVNRQIHGKRKKTSARQASMQGGRGVQQMPAARQVVGRMAGAPDTPQQTVTNHSVTTVEVEALDAARKLAPQGGIVMPEVRKRNRSCAPDSFRSEVVAFVKKFKSRRRMWTRTHGLTKCLHMLDEVKEMKRKRRYNLTRRDNDFLERSLGPDYTDSLRPALKELQQQAENGVGWQYVDDLDCLAACFALVTDKSEKKDDCRREVKKTYQLFFDFELNYLEHIKSSPSRYSVEHSVNIIDEMLSDSSPVHQFSFFFVRCHSRFQNKERAPAFCCSNKYECRER